MKKYEVNFHLRVTIAAKDEVDATEKFMKLIQNFNGNYDKPEYLAIKTINTTVGERK